ncbi:MAG TPA: hypothetical protein VFY23_10130 [Candidatus Limnocylindrales bacterium]|nr:hypothetical protein [Candidatus Limnocylindrales bacterium]
MAKEDDWRRFEAELAEALARMAPETYLIIEARDGTPGFGRYVQFAHSRTVFRAEASSNAYLRGEKALRTETERALVDLGWQPATGDETTRNFARTWKEQPTPFDEVAALAARTFAAFDVAEPAQLQFRYASFAGTAVPDLPLTIAREGERAPRPTPSRHRHDLLAFRATVERALMAALHADHLVTDDDGDWPIRLGSAMTYVRVVDGLPPALQAFSVLLRGVAVTAELLSELNSINARLRYVRVYAVERAVIASLELPAVNLAPEAIGFAVVELGNVADALDDQLKGHFGGTVMFDSSPKLLN